jgi:hypothetical protein
MPSNTNQGYTDGAVHRCHASSLVSPTTFEDVGTFRT